MDISNPVTSATNLNIGQKNDPTDVNKSPQAGIKKAAMAMESFFLFQVLEIMQPKPEDDTLFSGGAGEEMFRSTLNEINAREITKAGGIGLADSLYGQLLALQEIAPQNP